MLLNVIYFHAILKISISYKEVFFILYECYINVFKFYWTAKVNTKFLLSYTNHPDKVDLLYSKLISSRCTIIYNF